MYYNHRSKPKRWRLKHQLWLALAALCIVCCYAMVVLHRNAPAIDSVGGRGILHTGEQPITGDDDLVSGSFELVTAISQLPFTSASPVHTLQLPAVNDNTYSYRILLPHLQHWLIIVAAEHSSHVEHNHNVLTLMGWLVPTKQLSAADVSQFTPVQYLQQHLLCHAHGDGSNVVSSIPSVWLENAYAEIQQSEPIMIQCMAPDEVTSVSRIELEHTVNAQRRNYPPLQRPSDAQSNVATACTQDQQVARNLRQRLGFKHEPELRPYVHAQFYDKQSQSMPPQRVSIPIAHASLTTSLLSICTQPIHGKVDISKLTQWLDWHLYIGVDVMYLYYREFSFALQPELRPYMTAGRVELIYWPLPPGSFHFTWRTNPKQNIDQSVALRHCMARARHTDAWVLYIDVDEYVTLTHPQQQLYAPSEQLLDDRKHYSSMLAEQLYEHMHVDATMPQVGAVWLAGAQYFQYQPSASASSWHISDFPLRSPQLTWKRTKLLTRPKAIIENWLHSAYLYTDQYSDSFPMKHLRQDDSTESAPLGAHYQADIERYHSIRLNHYVTVTANRTLQSVEHGALMRNELVQSQDTLVDASDTLVDDSMIVLRVITAIGQYKASVSWPQPRTGSR